MASGSDLDFSPIGLSAALTSALAQTFMNISIKKVRDSSGYSGQKSFLGMTIVATLTTIPVVMAAASAASTTNNTTINTITRIVDVQNSLVSGDSWPLSLIVLAAIAYHIEYVMNFIFVGYVSAVTFSVCDIARRIAIITIGAIVFNKVLTRQNWVGISVALGGVLWYSYLDNASKATKPDVISSSSKKMK